MERCRDNTSETFSGSLQTDRLITIDRLAIKLGIARHSHCDTIVLSGVLGRIPAR